MSYQDTVITSLIGHYKMPVRVERWVKEINDPIMTNYCTSELKRFIEFVDRNKVYNRISELYDLAKKTLNER